MNSNISISNAIILVLCLACASCDASKQSEHPRNMKLPTDATHLDFSWPEIKAYELEAIAFHIPRENIDTSRIRLATDGSVEKVFFKFNFKDISQQEKDLNSLVSSRQSDKESNNISLNYIAMHPYPFTNNNLIDDFNKNINNTARPEMILDGMQSGMTRYTLVECYTSEQLKYNSSAQSSLKVKPSDENTPENCFLNRKFYYLTNLSLSKSEFFPMAAECNGGHCDVRFSIEGRALTISMPELNIKYIQDISIASRNQIEKYIQN